ncbi:MAG: hypothetical protein B7Y39_12135 [Bdellovibrio sp. 28-41-41]|nr:MAG: hypothetical protein B7Y39_12135 [Bdellovibrio sp. 28-41-41]
MKDIRYIADLLDTKFKLPNGWRFGLDGLLGLIPGFGNIVTDIMSFYILIRAALLGCPPAVILRMALNVVIDNIVDKVPVLGLLFDFIWKANTKNIKLMDDYFTNPQKTNKSSKLLMTVMILGLFGLFVACVVLSISILIWAFNEFYKNIPG